MAEQKFVNDNGLAALNRLATDDPKLFLSADPDALIVAMERLLDTSDLWGGPLDIKGDISELNQVEIDGPTTDAQFTPVVRNALGHLPPAEGLNEHRWATINCFLLPQYVQIRWSDVEPKTTDRLPGHVQRHWLRGGTVDARRANAVGRLWWLGEFSDRAARYSHLYNEDEILEAMSHNVNLYHQLLSRPNLLSRSKLLAAIYEVFLEPDNDYIRTTRYANEMLQSLNFIAAQVSLDFMNLPELREVVEEAKPPKEQ